MFRQVSITSLIRPLLVLAILFVGMVLYLSERQNAIDRQVDAIIKSVESMQESQQRLLDEQLQLSLDTNKTGVSISSHDSQIDVLDQYTKVLSTYFNQSKIWISRVGPQHGLLDGLGFCVL